MTPSNLRFTMNQFLALKNWQLFWLLVGIPFLVQLGAFVASLSGNGSVVPFYFLSIIMVLMIGLFFGWFYTLGTNLHKKLPRTVTMNLNMFKIFLFIPVIYILFSFVFMSGLDSNISSNGQPDFGIFAWIVTLHLFSMFCIFYCLYFNAKALKAVELQRPVSFSNFAGELFLFWFFPIGIWIIQLRINKLFHTASDNNIQ